MLDVEKELGEFFLRVKKGGFLDRWADGLGLEPEHTRVNRMLGMAQASFLAHRTSGVPFHEAADIALGLTQGRRGNMTHVNREGVTPPAKVQGEY